MKKCKDLSNILKHCHPKLDYQSILWFEKVFFESLSDRII
jgi:hypothetical protein